jgi:acetyl esterase/lipase
MTALSRTAVAFLLALLSFVGCATGSPNSYRLSTVIYSPGDWPVPLEAELYEPVAGSGPYPAMLLVHGGSWEGGSRDDMRSWAQRFVKRGFVVLNVSYRLAPDYLFPAPVHDLQQAMHWLHANAESLGVDPRHIVAAGYSAGAHLVALMALAADTGSALDQPYGGAETRPAAVIAGSSPMDLRKYRGGRLVPQFLGGRIDEVPQTFALASPVTHVHADAPPFFLFHGRRDRLVTPDHSSEFAAELTAAGGTAAVEWLAWRGHILSFLTAGVALDAADRFLMEVFNHKTTKAP